MKKRQYLKSLYVALLGSLCWLSVKAQSQLFTPEQMSKIENKLIGEHKFALQWISWDKFGTAEISRDATGLVIKGEQELDGNSVSLFGRIKVIDESAFLFTGEIVTIVYHVNKGKACTRHGTYEFRATDKRKYWSLQQMDSPCDSVVDYIDIFF
ncbi:hypothetical protein M8853_00400 [Pasteurella multocida]|uniref:hypothetical protein n=1 Tax=Pasteurella multocida TaxID=747 RepID=UPI0007ECBF46|nr:hypothetical protein [Pasteurella multocida]MCL7827308.1 hypothetical protein [Pasteurella multocida]MCL7839665.1 hypothetical protein [Pasteurella multocida]OBP34305.1 hypothetical protein A0R69_06175 [Pasteurella multocida subsp. multocida]PNM10307.1 hypothetical protein A6J59_006450 [Pasteurella multocida]URH92096.1 hypothetical protein M8853_00400 [Pasteurella multocida]